MMTTTMMTTTTTTTMMVVVVFGGGGGGDWFPCEYFHSTAEPEGRERVYKPSRQLSQIIDIL